ncbi:hypothetical protein ACVOMT_24190 (plasmid) [Sphingomonas panni]|uniref:hypothetical protein n=1 Tax=uncultured Sphingomonas sp. TaxID=158754 RepID=UPI00258673CB|nr:hypothetical protein [uncultured Sphingomonas sp.]
MATQFVATDAPTTTRRVKKIAKSGHATVAPTDVVKRLYAKFPDDMMRLAE